MSNKNNFNEFRFNGFKVSDRSNKYWRINSRINETGDKIIVRYCTNQVFSTAFGYGLRIDHDKGVWLKQWQVSKVWDETLGDFVYEIVLDKAFTKITNFKEDDDILVSANSKDPDALKACVDDDGIIHGKEWDYLTEVAKEQTTTPVIWAK